MTTRQKILTLVGLTLFVPIFLFAQHAKDYERLKKSVYEIEEEIKKIHLPFDTIVEVVFDKPSGGKVVGYAGGYGDSAIWSGHYLAAEAFRCAVTEEKTALENVQRVLGGITRLIYVAGEPGRLTRFAVPKADPFAKTLSEDDRFEGEYEGVKYYWTGNFISRDQYAGVMFGMGVAYELVDDRTVKERIRENVDAILSYLLKNKWRAYKPDGKISTTWTGNPAQMLCFLKIGQLVEPKKFGEIYEDYAERFSSKVTGQFKVTCSDTHFQYYKFNLMHITIFNLTRLEKQKEYRESYIEAVKVLRNAIGTHENAHFDLIAAAVVPELKEKLGKRVIVYLLKWLNRPRRKVLVKNSADLTIEKRKYGRKTIAVRPLPIEKRPTTDFLWQRSPYKLDGGGNGRAQAPGLDLILPYWMARYYGIIRE